MLANVAAVMWMRMARLRLWARLRRWIRRRCRRRGLIRCLSRRDMNGHSGQRAPLRAVAGTIEKGVHANVSGSRHVMQRAIPRQRYAAMQRLAEQAGGDRPTLW